MTPLHLALCIAIGTAAYLCLGALLFALLLICGQKRRPWREQLRWALGLAVVWPVILLWRGTW